VYGDRGSLAWRHEDPHHLRYCPVDGAPQLLAQGAEWLSADAQRWTRVGLGHPEGFFEAFANLYTEVADALLAKSEGHPYARSDLSFPDVTDGVRGVAFVESAMGSYAKGGVWTQVETI
jgi:predicted dehydrogenase